MIEKFIKDYLDAELSVPAYMEILPGHPESFVVIEKTGSAEEDHVKTATIAVQSYAGTLYGAAALNEQVKSAMADIIEEDEISKCSLNTDYSYTDTQKKGYRYQAVFDIVYL